MKKWIIYVLLFVLALAVSARYFYPSEAYERFEYHVGFNAARCEQYYESCTCYGSLSVAERYPPVYMCRGFESCEDIDRSVGPGC